MQAKSWNFLFGISDVIYIFFICTSEEQGQELQAGGTHPGDLVYTSMKEPVDRCAGGGAAVVVVLRWWCFGGGAVVVMLWWWYCGDGAVVMVLW